MLLNFHMSSGVKTGHRVALEERQSYGSIHWRTEVKKLSYIWILMGTTLSFWKNDIDIIFEFSYFVREIDAIILKELITKTFYTTHLFCASSEGHG
ncbi:hypothetical protein CDAR_223671 [Caerostris darwini]|uniref:Uncharacterized protein n=1 Tax=Caerostris darwini TaxID=1538125 RepID=A0AAV4RX51_9ARAC|nr:hypothetical protein CDAR_223671 [Caerostris darwini]